MHELEIFFFFPPLQTSGSSAGGFEITSTHTDTRTACYLYISSALVLVEKQLYSCVTFIDAIHFLIATCCTMLSCRSFHFCNWNAWMWNVEFLWEERVTTFNCVHYFAWEYIRGKSPKKQTSAHTFMNVLNHISLLFTDHIVFFGFGYHSIGISCGASFAVVSMKFWRKATNNYQFCGSFFYSLRAAFERCTKTLTCKHSQLLIK